MYDREFGCKTIGCFTAMIVIMGFFAYLLNVAQGMAERQHAPAGAVGVAPVGPPDMVPGPPGMMRRIHQNPDDIADAANILRLPLLMQAMRSYASAHGGALPPMGTPEAFRAAVFPKYLNSEEALHSPRTGAPYVPNPALSGKALASVAKPDSVVAFYEPMPASGVNASRARAVVFLSGDLRAAAPVEWKTLQKTLATSGGGGDRAPTP